MNFDNILALCAPEEEGLLKAGFSFDKKADAFVLKQPVADGAFVAQVSVSKKHIDAKCFDSQTDDMYALLDSPRAHGKFVAALREEVFALVQKIREQAFKGKDLYNEYRAFIKNELGVTGDFPWKDDNGPADDYEVFRLPNKKWFALLMNIPFKCLGIKSEEKVHVVNLKAAPKKIPTLVDGQTIFPAYHMNKKHWITAVLSERCGLERLKELTRESYAAVGGKVKI